MPDITQSQAIANLTNRFNQLLENAKKVNELPAQLVLDSNSKVHVMIDGKSEYLKISQIIEASNSENLTEAESYDYANHAALTLTF